MKEGRGGARGAKEASVKMHGCLLKGGRPSPPLDRSKIVEQTRGAKETGEVRMKKRTGGGA